MENFDKLMMEEWGKTWQDGQVELKKPDTFTFAEVNPYMEQSENLKLAKQLVEEGKTQEAILCLEAEVQKNHENAEAWRLMGQLFQENDQDDFAIISFKKAYEVDPYDLDSLLCLGISCTNELNEMEATQYLHNWL